MHESRTATRTTKPSRPYCCFHQAYQIWTLGRDVALFANGLALQERRGTGAVFDGAIQGYFTVSMGV